MKSHFSISGVGGEYLIDNLTDNCRKCLGSCRSEGHKIPQCPEYNEERRQGVLTTGTIQTFLCDRTKTTKLFRDKLQGLSYCVPELQNVGEQLARKSKEEERRRVNGLLHNLVNINARSIQEMFLYEQNLSAIRTARDIVDRFRDQLTSDPTQGAKLLLRVMKNNLLMKSEFSAFEKLENSGGFVSKSTHDVRKVLLNVLHAFLDDFSTKGIYVEVQQADIRIAIDYDSVQVALVNVIENAAKYSKPDSRIVVAFTQEASGVQIEFEMISLHIQKGELTKLYDEGYSGIASLEHEKSGKGLGMWMAQRMLKLNNAVIEFDCDEEVENSRDEDGRLVPYSNNRIVIRFNSPTIDH